MKRLIIDMYKISFKDLSYYIASDSFVEEVSKKWEALAKVVKKERIKI